MIQPVPISHELSKAFLALTPTFQQLLKTPRLYRDHPSTPVNRTDYHHFQVLVSLATVARNLGLDPENLWEKRIDSELTTLMQMYEYAGNPLMLAELQIAYLEIYLLPADRLTQAIQLAKKITEAVDNCIAMELHTTVPELSTEAKQSLEKKSQVDRLAPHQVIITHLVRKKRFTHAFEYFEKVSSRLTPEEKTILGYHFFDQLYQRYKSLQPSIQLGYFLELMDYLNEYIKDVPSNSHYFNQASILLQLVTAEYGEALVKSGNISVGLEIINAISSQKIKTRKQLSVLTALLSGNTVELDSHISRLISDIIAFVETDQVYYQKKELVLFQLWELIRETSYENHYPPTSHIPSVEDDSSRAFVKPTIVQQELLLLKKAPSVRDWFSAMERIKMKEARDLEGLTLTSFLQTEPDRVLRSPEDSGPQNVHIGHDVTLGMTPPSSTSSRRQSRISSFLSEVAKLAAHKADWESLQKILQCKDLHDLERVQIVLKISEWLSRGTPLEMLV